MFLPDGRDYLCPTCKEGMLRFHDYCMRSIRHSGGCILRRRTDTGAFAGGHSAALADIDLFVLKWLFFVQ